MCAVEDEAQKFRDAFRAAGWEIVKDPDPTYPRKVSGQYEVLGPDRRLLMITFDPDRPYDDLGQISLHIHDVYRGAVARTDRVLTPQEVLAAFTYDR
jgi:hypothetical protein